MTAKRSFKRLVRARMEKTGESYTSARAALLAAVESKATEGPALTMSDDAIRRRTGRGWEEWFDVLDAWGAAGRTHTEIARWVAEQHSIDGWHSQAVAVSFERASGRRAVGEYPDGFRISASKTVAVSIDRLYTAFANGSARKRWLPDGDLRTRTALEQKSIRFDWDGGDTRVNVFFTAKDEAKSSVSIQHERLADGEEAERMKTYWRERLTALKGALER